jgi:hypothetical protein
MKPKTDARRIIHQTMLWSKAFVPVIALLAAVASSIRTVQTTAEIYARSGSDPRFVVVAALAFTMSVEGALFLLALAQENQRMKWRQAHKPRHVTTLRTIVYSINVRLGRVEPLSYDKMPDNDSGLSALILVAFLFAIASNLYLGMRPFLEQVGKVPLQSIFVQLWHAEASVQLTFIVDMAGVLFPPFMALKAGHLTARFASEVSSAQSRTNRVQDRMQEASSERNVKAFKKTPRERVVEHLAEHPEDEALSQHKLAKKIGVSVGTVNAVIKEIRASTKPVEHSENGRHHE